MTKIVDFRFHLPTKNYKQFYCWFNDKWNLFNIHWVDKPLRTWWKAKKFFKRPKIYIHFFWSKHIGLVPGPYVWTKRYGKILDFYVNDVGWKDKYDSPRFEESPSIFLCLFRKFGFVITWHQYWHDEFGKKRNVDTAYWEYLLEYVHYKRGLKLDSFWIHDSEICFKREYDDEGDLKEIVPYKVYVPTHLFSLNKRGLKIFKELHINDKTRNNRNCEVLE